MPSAHAVALQVRMVDSLSLSLSLSATHRMAGFVREKYTYLQVREYRLLRFKASHLIRTEQGTMSSSVQMRLDE